MLVSFIKDAPIQPKVILNSQLTNIQRGSKDARERRVISVCLSLRGRSRKAYQDLNYSGMLLLPSGHLLSYYPIRTVYNGTQASTLQIDVLSHLQVQIL